MHLAALFKDGHREELGGGPFNLKDGAPKFDVKLPYNSRLVEHITVKWVPDNVKDSDELYQTSGFMLWPRKNLQGLAGMFKPPTNPTLIPAGKEVPFVLYEKKA